MSILVVAGIAHHEGEILMGRRLSTDSDAPDLWEFPGGKVEPGEALESALRREFHEELGIVFEVCKPFLSFWWIYPPNKKIDLEFFLVPLSSKVLGTAMDPSHSELRWFKKSELPGLKVLEANQRVIQALINFF